MSEALRALLPATADLAPLELVSFLAGSTSAIISTLWAAGAVGWWLGRR